ncbi:NAD(P)-dependent oxidoreductase [Ruegeria sp. PrR005]|uniref:NAD-dependent epimerase/dehydratase family protein n=1 Tax=Ruegeria sp. PrR005 TaxID=2706882 RepID=A0A6B2NP23_9RHOB|nr:NAD-dependent epimerase/dehydratase family protein [Ruegeria sp. PrR005]NDW44259.1 NAD-dependent epimerase/dehydratase family protein [Ruegeria sp. PrR005]
MSFPALLVLGATGRIGRVLRHCWAGQGDKVLWQGRYRPSAAEGHWVIYDPLRDMAAGEQAARGRAVILCLAGVTHGQAARGADFDDNLRLAEAAIRAGAASGARVLLASSAAVYGNRPGLLGEDLPPAPVHPYGQAKARMETQGAALAADLGVGLTSLRIGNIAGLDAILGGWRAGFALDVLPGGGTPRRSYIGLSGLAAALAAVAAAPELPAVLNIASPGTVAMGDLLDAAGLDWHPRPAPADVIAQVELDTTRLAALSPVGASPSDPAGMVADWQRIRPYLAEGQERS